MFYSNVLIIALTLCKLAIMKEIGRFLAQDANEDLELELLKKIEIERMKAQVIKELGMTYPPIISNNSSPPLSDAVIRLLLADHVPPERQHNNFAKLLFFPANSDFHCLRNEIPSCRRFEFNILPDRIYTSSEFWMYKIKFLPDENRTLSAVCSLRGGEEQQLQHYEILEEDEKWLSFPLPLFKHLKLLKRNTTCTLEVTGMELGEEKHNLPFMKVIEDLKAHARGRRSEDSLNRNDACRPIPFRVSFDEIGFSEFVVHPKDYEANVCSGYCLKSPNTYETVLDLVYEKNATLQALYGRCWATCCRPKGYASMDFIYSNSVDGEVVHNVTTLANIIVTSCVCS